MSTEENKAAVLRFAENLGVEAVNDFVTDDVVYHNPPPGQPPGKEGYRMLIGGFLTAFPDMRFDVEDQLAEGDRVVSRFTITGTHKGDLMGMPQMGRTIRTSGISVQRFRDGRVAEEWEQVDFMTMMQQLGAMQGG
jgi:steroid delta-isomerase-like uncharacterized protein